MRVKDGGRAILGDVVDGGGQVGQVSSVGTASEGVRDQTFHGKGNTEDVVALANQCLPRYVSIMFLGSNDDFDQQQLTPIEEVEGK